MPPAFESTSDSSTLSILPAQPPLTRPTGPLQLRRGRVLHGRFLLEEEVGRGAMGVVWRVLNLECDSVVRALKLIGPGLTGDGMAYERFRREARVMARFQHDHSVVFYTEGIARDPAYIEMEYIEGEGLGSRLRGIPKPLDWVERINGQICDMLGAAQEQQIVHRDLKPSNIILLAKPPGGKDYAKVIDFGLAKFLGQNPDSPPSYYVVGTMPYVSPEQCHERPVDHRSDLYSWGIVLYEMLTGRRPFAGNIGELIHAHESLPPPPFAARNPAACVPPDVETVVMKCLAKDPSDRFQSGGELQREFRSACSRV